MEVRGTRFVLEDGNGKDRIVIEMDRGQPCVKMMGDNGYPQLVLSIDEGKRPRVSLASPTGNPVIHLEVADGPHSVGTALLLLLGDYPNEGRKEVRVTNGGAASQPEVSLESNGAVIAHMP